MPTAIREIIKNDNHTLETSFGYHAELSKAHNIKGLNQRIENIIKTLGLTDYSFIQLAKANTEQPELCTLPKNLLYTYFDEGYFSHDMVLQKAFNATTPFFQSTIHDYISNSPFSSKMTHCMEKIYTLYKSYGYYNFYHVIKHSDSNSVMLSTTQRGVSPIEFKHNMIGHETTLTLLCEAIDFVINKHFHTLKYTHENIPSINAKPLRVLQTLANNDMTIEQVANKLCISVVTANQHLKSVRVALGTRTNYASIKKAVLNHLIALEPEVGTLKGE